MTTAIATIRKRVGFTVVSKERFRALFIPYETRDVIDRPSCASRQPAAGVIPPAPAANQFRTARCAECAVDPQHPTARACRAANCPIRHVASADHAGRDAA